MVAGGRFWVVVTMIAVSVSVVVPIKLKPLANDARGRVMTTQRVVNAFMSRVAL